MSSTEDQDRLKLIRRLRKKETLICSSFICL